ncbi:MAG TPA: AsnC family transcriptional regulator [Ruminococcaceae bacterium]|nr:AsnC family transcriptional regulator [Oscillospiraceae bacterium]
MVFNGLDEIDNKILTLLRENARLNYSDIGETVGLTRVAVKNRIKSLEEKGIIRGYHAEINPIAAPETLPFYAYIETKPELYDSVTEKLKNEPMVSLLFRISGNNAIFAICAAESKEDRANFAWRVRNSYDGITAFSAKDIWEVVKGNILPD